MEFYSIDDINKYRCQAIHGDRVAFVDPEGRVRIGTVRLKEVRRPKNVRTRHRKLIYAYAQYRVGKKVKEKYIGIAR